MNVHISSSLRHNIDKLRQCDCLTEEERNGKYKKAIIKLKKEIKKEADELFQSVQTAIGLDSFAEEEEMEAAKEYLISIIGVLYPPLLQEALFEAPDADEFEFLMISFKRDIMLYSRRHNGVFLDQYTGE